jgi:hypothetical protein
VASTVLRLDDAELRDFGRSLSVVAPSVGGGRRSARVAVPLTTDARVVLTFGWDEWTAFTRLIARAVASTRASPVRGTTPAPGAGSSDVWT